MTDSQKRPRKIAFFGHFGKGNFGNESTLQAMLHHLRQVLPDAEVTCICNGPEATAATYRIEAVPIGDILDRSWGARNPLVRLARLVCVGLPGEPYRWIKGILMLRRTDMFVIPGTGLLTDAYGLLDWGPYNLFKWSLIAKICRCKLVFASVGAGPLYGAVGRWLAKSALALADFRSYRDDSTLQYLKELGYRTNSDRVYPDLAFSLPAAPPPPRDSEKSRRPVVGLGLMAYAETYSVPHPSAATYPAYLESLVEVVDWLLATDHDVRLLIGDLWDVRVKHEFKRLLRERLPTYDDARIIDEPISSVEDLMAQLAVTDIVVATRFHNLLLALLAVKPVVSISFHHKCVSLMNAVGLSEYCLDIEDLKADTLIEKLRELEKNADGLKSAIGEKVAEFRKALDEQYRLVFDAV